MATAERSWAVRVIRRHPAFLALFAIGLAVRVAVSFEYYPAFGYFVDTYAYITAAKSWAPHYIWPFGYSGFLATLAWTNHTVTVALVQHSLGLATAVLVYGFLVRRGIAVGIAALASAPLLLDARQIVVEHYILSDTLFSVLLVLALGFILWRKRPPTWMIAAGGLLLAMAALTRTVGQLLPLLVLAYLLLRKVGWRRLAVFGLSIALPMGAYMVWFHDHYGRYGLNAWSGRYLWSRTTAFVDCANPDFTPAELRICPREPVGERLTADSYLWYADPDQLVLVYQGIADDRVYRTFALKAIKAQPDDYVRLVLTETVQYFQPGFVGGPRTRCINDLWKMPSGPLGGPSSHMECGPPLMVSQFEPKPDTVASGAVVTPVNSVLSVYGRVVTVPQIALLVLSLFALVAAGWRVKRPGVIRNGPEIVLLVGVGACLIGVSLALSTIDFRYSLPLLSLVPAAAALGWQRLTDKAPGVPEAQPPVQPGDEAGIEEPAKAN